MLLSFEKMEGSLPELLPVSFFLESSVGKNDNDCTFCCNAMRTLHSPYSARKAIFVCNVCPCANDIVYASIGSNNVEVCCTCP